MWKIKCVAEGPHKGRTVAAKIINLAKVNSSFEDIRVRAAAVSCAHPFGSARQLGSLPARERAERSQCASQLFRHRLNYNLHLSLFPPPTPPPALSSAPALHRLSPALQQEVQIMQLASHPNILACYCSFVAREDLWLVMRFMNKGSCLHVLRCISNRGAGAGMLEHLVATILRDTLSGLQYFHSTGKIHRDIKAGNILLDDNGSVCLADFGVSGWLADGFNHRHRQTFVGTPCWMAPEVMEQKDDGYDCKVRAAPCSVPPP